MVAVLVVHGQEATVLVLELAAALGADESVDAQRLLAGGGVRVFNIRLAKNGGLLPALRIARLVLAGGRDVQLGCMVGETSLLSAAGVAFLEACPKVRFAEGAFGRRLLSADVLRRSVQFGGGGRVRLQAGWGWGVEVDTGALERLSAVRPRTLQI